MSTNLFRKKNFRARARDFSTENRDFRKNIFLKIVRDAAESRAEIFSIFARAAFFARERRAEIGLKNGMPRNAEKIDLFSSTRHSMIKHGTRCRQKTSRGYGTSEMSGRGDNLRVERSCAGRITSRGAASETSFMARAFHMKLETSTTNFLSGRASSKMLS